MLAQPTRPPGQAPGMSMADATRIILEFRTKVTGQPQRLGEVNQQEVQVALMLVGAQDFTGRRLQNLDWGTRKMGAEALTRYAIDASETGPQNDIAGLALSGLKRVYRSASHSQLERELAALALARVLVGLEEKQRQSTETTTRHRLAEVQKWFHEDFTGQNHPQWDITHSALHWARTPIPPQLR
ncbi:MAG: hypothetical protein V1703_02955 [Candidatus Altiarchaeota archaeon]